MIVRRVIEIVADILTFAIIARALLTWFPIRQDNPIVNLLNVITEPFLAPLRRIIPRIGMIDISPLVAILILQLIRTIV
ncbi:MAG: YggT family protein [Chloroflexi bacterium]|nr:YggT family protein [Chloroflexota bacterium]